jgi:hypothetical protein
MTELPPDVSREPAVTLSPDERAAVRAFLQRSEVRLSTLHRVATALLSGAGLVVLLPAIERDAVTVVLRALVTDLTWTQAVLVVAMIGVLALPLIALWMLLRELTRFYFHSHHLHNSDGSRVFIPRFTLTGLRVPTDDLDPVATAALRAAREQPDIYELLVPDKDATRARIDRQLAAYSQQGGSDQQRSAGLLGLVASKDRDLLEEAAKVEAGMARHLLRLQTIVLRYVKALLVFVVTAIVVFAAAAVTGTSSGGVRPLSSTQLIVITALLGVWAPVIALVTATPVRWVEGLLQAEGAHSTPVAADPELTQMERLVMGYSTVGLVLAVLAMAGIWVKGGLSGALTTGGGAVLLVAVLAQAAAIRRWRQRSRTLR